MVVEARIPWRELLARTSRKTLPDTLKQFVLAIARATDARAV